MNLGAQLCSKSQSAILSNAAATRLPAQQPKSRSTSGARDRYVVLGSIYSGLFKINTQRPEFELPWNHCEVTERGKFLQHRAWFRLQASQAALRQVSL